MPDHEVNFQIIEETDDWIVIDKPAGLLVHPTKPGGPPTLWDGLRELLAYEMVNKGQISLINRLDRETSGLVLVCKNTSSARTFAMAMEEKRIRKAYHALVYGWPEEDHFTVTAPLLRIGEKQDSKIWLKRGIHPEGDFSETQAEVLERRTHPQKNARLSLVKARPLTGRTHQIRVHLASKGHPVIGDKIYGPNEEHYLQFIDKGWTPELEKDLWLPRHALHSSLLEVTIQGKVFRWESPLPPDMQQILTESAACPRP
ncbi:MAG: RluA family pseudouridine synthase [Chthoniobacterales bacterium]